MDSDDGGMLFSKGIDFSELFNGGTDFEIDMNSVDIQKNLDPLLYNDEDTFEDFLKDQYDPQENLAELMKNLELAAQIHKLRAPEYTNFKELSESMFDCLSSGDVKMLVREEGDGPLVPPDAVVTIRYAAYWENEVTPFDATCEVPKTFRMGHCKSLPGLEVGLSMVHGPAARFYLLLTPKASWGPLGALPRIKPETALFVVQLLEVKDVGAVERFNDLPSAEQVKFSTTVKTVTASNQQAKDAFQQEKYMKALKCYHKSLSVLQLSKPETTDERDAKTKWMTKVYMNLAVCYYKLNRPTKILLMCDELGRLINTPSSKQMFYYAKAFEMLNDYDQAMLYYQKALRIEPENRDIGGAVSKLQSKLKNNYVEEKKMCSNIFRSVAQVNHIVSDEFKEALKEMCDELSLKPDYSRLDLIPDLMDDDRAYAKSFVGSYENLIFIEDGNKCSVMKKVRNL